jgi:hypothetical protein
LEERVSGIILNDLCLNVIVIIELLVKRSVVKLTEQRGVRRVDWDVRELVWVRKLHLDGYDRAKRGRGCVGADLHFDELIL